MTELNVLVSSHPVYRVLQILHERTRSEMMYPEEIHQHVPEMSIRAVDNILQRLRRGRYVSCDSAYGPPKRGKQFYGITLSGDKAYEGLHGLLQSEREASSKLKESRRGIRRELRRLKRIRDGAKHC